MSSNKKTVAFNCDKDIWDLAKDKLPVSRSQFIENQLKMAIGLEDEETEIVKQINKKQREINVLKDRLCTVREIKHKEKKLINKESTSLDIAFNVVERIDQRLGYIGINKIGQIAKQFEVDKEELRDLCVAGGIDIVQFS